MSPAVRVYLIYTSYCHLMMTPNTLHPSRQNFHFTLYIRILMCKCLGNCYLEDEWIMIQQTLVLRVITVPLIIYPSVYLGCLLRGPILSSLLIAPAVNIVGAIYMDASLAQMRDVTWKVCPLTLGNSETMLSYLRCYLKNSYLNHFIILGNFRHPLRPSKRCGVVHDSLFTYTVYTY
jgi:hypothetical protein